MAQKDNEARRALQFEGGTCFNRNRQGVQMENTQMMCCCDKC